jgi:glutamyl-tRNA(Gln) amidotransferase subunit E
VLFRSLGIPLIEIATCPDIVSPEHAKEVANKIGLILRSVNNVKRGIGTIRQDVNISIKGGARTEIKGFQDLKSIPQVIENEIKRQESLIKKGKKIEKEVRKAEPDGTTTFLRPMPGAARMYPETDVLPVKIDRELLKSASSSELIEDRIKRFEKDYGLSKDLATMTAKSDKSSLFDELSKKAKSVKPAFIAEVILSRPLEVKRKHNVDVSVIKDSDFEQLISLIDEGKVSKDSVSDIILELAKSGSFNPSKYAGVDDSAIESEIKKVVEQNKGAPTGALMGMIMAKFKGKADGKKVMDILKKLS